MTGWSRLLVALGALLSVLALLGTWADRQLLSTDDWTATSGALLREPEVREALADRISADLADGSRVTAELRQALPPRLQPLAEPAGGLVREGVHRLTLRVLGSPAVQDLWVEANRVTHRQLVGLVEGEGRELAGRGVVLDLRPLEERVAAEAGLELDVERLGVDGRVVILRADQLDALRSAVDLLHLLGWLLAVLALLCFAAAIWLAKADRRRALVASALGLAGAGLLVLVVRRVAGHELAVALTDGGPSAPVVETVWRIGTSLLADLAVVFVLVGLVALLGAWLVGPGRAGSRVRELIAPWLLERSEVAYGVAGAGFLALAAFGPLSVLRRPLALVVLAALLLVGVGLLRRSVRRSREAGSRGARSPGTSGRAPATS
jgi:hypothetical protein